jgi:membrane-associated phospholipid phosphatase
MALLGAASGVVLLALTWYAKAHISLVERVDRSILQGFAGLSRPGLDRFTSAVANLCDPKPYVVLAAIPVLIALVRRRPRVAVAIGVIEVGANATTQWLKLPLAEPHTLGVGKLSLLSGATWPSGHATAAMSLALCMVIASSARWRPRVAAAMTVFSVAVCYSFLELEWHYPSDVLGGFLVAATWTLLAAAALDLIDARWPRRWGRPLAGRTSLSLGEALAPIVLLLAGAATFGILLAVARPHAAVSYARDHEAFVIGAAAIGALGLVLATGAMLALRLSVPAGARQTRGGPIRPAGSDPAPTAAPRLRSPRGSG